MTNQETLKLALDALQGSIAITMAKIDLRNEAIKALEEALKQEQGEPVSKMTARRAEMFMSRFKHEEKMLGPNEQAALDYVIDILVAKQEQGEPVAKAWAEGYRMGIADERTSEANIGIAGFNAKVEPDRQNPYGIPQPKQEQGEPWGACVSGRVFVGALPEHVRKLSEAEGLTIQWLYTTPQPKRNPLTDEQKAEIVKSNTVEGYHGDYYLAFDIIDDVEAAHGIRPSDFKE